MKSYIKVLFFGFLFFCLQTGLLAARETAEDFAREMIKEKAKEKSKEEPIATPDFQLQDIYQEIYTLSDYRGKQPIVLFFWATWYPFCQRELGVLNNMYAGLEKDGVQLLSIDVGELSDQVEGFVRHFGLAYPVLLDKDTRVADSFGIDVPAYVFIEKSGAVVYKGDSFAYDKYKTLLLGKAD